MNLISVIIPVYNSEKYLRACLDSVINQTYKHLDIILINDGSTDQSGYICDEYAKKDSRIKVIHQNNQGVSAARNKGMSEIKGDYVSFIDADDTLDLDMYELLYMLILKYKADIAHCGYKHIVGDEVRFVHDTKTIHVQRQNEALKCLIGGRLFVGSLWNKLYSVKLLKNIKFDESIKINEDILFNFEVFRRAKLTVFADYSKYNYIARLNTSACFITADEKKAKDACFVNRYIYTESKDTSLSSLSAERYMRSLSVYYRSVDEKDIKKAIRKQIWDIYEKNKNVGKGMKTTAQLIKRMPILYSLLYYAYNKLRKPNWEV